jgi:hypothetical protein
VNKEKSVEYESKLQKGEIGISTVLKELRAADSVDNAIAEIKDKSFREEMKTKYEQNKYKPATLKKLEKDITVHEHPERFTDEEKYYERAQKAIAIDRKLEEDFENKVAVMTIATPEDYKECNKWITQQASENRGFTCVCFFYLSEKMMGAKT